MQSHLARTRPPWTIRRAPGPVVATAIHGGHDLRPDVARFVALGDDERRREEDAHSGAWAAVGDARVVVHRSRFEVDLNRDRDHAVYVRPEDAWGLDVWRAPLPAEVAEASRELHDRFYEDLHDLLSRVQRAWGRFVVVDLHTYNHRRNGLGHPSDDPAANPQVNIGTGPVDRRRWAALVDRFIDDLAAQEVRGARLDVRENVRFRGAHLVTWVNETFAGAACALAVEVKKFFMDEHTGDLDESALKEIHAALEAAAAGAREELAR
jgi:N-formylglutamate deformylase